MNASADFEKTLWVGIAYTFIGNVLISIGFQLQKLVHMRRDGHYIKSPLWWAGLLSMALGEVGNLMAYATAPASLVALMGAVSVISNALLSRLFLKEIMSYTCQLGVAVALGGTALVVLNTPVSTDADDVVYGRIVSWNGLVFLVAFTLALVFVANPFKMRIAVPEAFARRHVVCYCLVCSLLEGFSVVSSKGVSVALTQAAKGNALMFTDSATCWLTYVLVFVEIVSNILQVAYLQKALENFNVSSVVPVYYILFTFVSIAVGMGMFDETVFDPLVRCLVLFVVGVLLAFAGVIVVNNERAEEDETQSSAGPEREFSSEAVRGNLVFVTSLKD
jgi:drug/metabolite transporter (DMT)-like permease